MRRVPVGYAVGTKRARRADGDHPRRDTVPEACAMIEITVYPHKRTKRDYANAMNAGLWDVDFNGETILTKRRDPEHDAARWLRDHGYGGPLQTRGKDGMIHLIYKSIESGLMVAEADARAIRTTTYYPGPAQRGLPDVQTGE